MAKKFYIATFGCRTNQADSGGIREEFLSRQFEETQQCRQADLIVVNSCTVTHRADQQVRQLTRKLRRLNPAARLVVAGCYAQRAPRTLARLGSVDLVVGNSHKRDLVQIAAALDSGGMGLPTEREIAAIYQDDFRNVPALGVTPATQTAGRTRPFVKIQDGCDAKCTYCIIPQVRGPSRSVPPQMVLEHIRRLVAEGFKEIVLTGIHMGSYGMHLKPRFSLDRLLNEIVAVEGLERVRLSSLEPMQLSRRIIALAASCGKVAPHFHICLQSGSDRILKKMLRPYTTSRFASLVEEIHQRIPDAAIGTDVIVGFPGESEEDHCQTVDFIGRMPFTYLHVFPYSDRTGTAAFRIADKVESRAIKCRSEELRKLSEEKNRNFRHRFLGQPLSVLTLSEKKDGMRTALSGNYLKAKLDPEVPSNRIVEARVVAEDRDGYQLLARLTTSQALLPPPRVQGSG